MAKIKQKLTTIVDALQTLDESIGLFAEYETIASDEPNIKNDQIAVAMRDSMIQRFEYCTDLFWKVLKLYLEEVEKVKLPSHSPRGIIREAVTVTTITEVEGQQCMKMIDKRNETSHIYHEEIAEEIAQEVPQFYQLIKKIVDRVQEKVTVG